MSFVSLRPYLNPKYDRRKDKAPVCIGCHLSAFQRTPREEEGSYVCSTCRALQALMLGRLEMSVLIPLEDGKDNHQHYVRGESGGGPGTCGRGCCWTTIETARRSCFKCGKLRIRGTSIFQWCWTCLNTKISHLVYDPSVELSPELLKYHQLHIEWLTHFRSLWRGEIDRSYPDISRLPVDPELPMYDLTREPTRTEVTQVMTPLMASADVIGEITSYI